MNILRFPRFGPEDRTFFHKHQLRVGTALRYYGRTDPGRLWFVTGIYSGEAKPRSETFPQTFADLVRVHNYNTGEVRFMRYRYLAYSAIWRIDE